MTECCEQQGLTLLAVETESDHIPLGVSVLPRLSPAQIANVLKGSSSRFLREKFPHLKQVCGKEQLWTSRYYVGTAGAVSAETIKRSITEYQGKEWQRGRFHPSLFDREGLPAPCLIGCNDGSKALPPVEELGMGKGLAIPTGRIGQVDVLTIATNDNE
jgi:putative transposase